MNLHNQCLAGLYFVMWLAAVEKRQRNPLAIIGNAVYAKLYNCHYHSVKDFEGRNQRLPGIYNKLTVA